MGARIGVRLRRRRRWVRTICLNTSRCGLLRKTRSWRDGVVLLHQKSLLHTFSPHNIKRTGVPTCIIIISVIDHVLVPKALGICIEVPGEPFQGGHRSKINYIILYYCLWKLYVLFCLISIDSFLNKKHTIFFTVF